MSYTSGSYMQKSVGQKTMSVYGGAGGYGTRISTNLIGYPSYLSNSGGSNLTDGLDLHVDASEKGMLQNLNDRLASYLEKVRKLEKENERMEKQIREWYTSKTVISHDYSSYLATVADLQEKIRAASTSKAKLHLEIDNTKLAADDFKMKSENELNFRVAVEGDIAGLKRGLDELNVERMNLESQYEFLNEELIMLKKNHKEEMSSQNNELGGQVIVEVQAPDCINLTQIIDDMREQYEAVTARNFKELEMWYQNKVSSELKVVEKDTASLGLASLEIKELRTTMQTLQIELQSHQSMKMSLEETLRETGERFAAKLAGLQAIVTGKEAQITTLVEDIAQMKQTYSTLLDLTTRLEAEIAEYRRLLDGEDDSVDSSKQVITKTITVQETYVDGKQVESTKSVN